jgi:hypothetical protein
MADYREQPRPDLSEVLHVWASVGSPDSPPDRVPVESCVSCGALVAVATFDTHGRWHARAALDRS